MWSGNILTFIQEMYLKKEQSISFLSTMNEVRITFPEASDSENELEFSSDSGSYIYMKYYFFLQNIWNLGILKLKFHKWFLKISLFRFYISITFAQKKILLVHSCMYLLINIHKKTYWQKQNFQKFVHYPWPMYW